MGHAVPAGVGDGDDGLQPDMRVLHRAEVPRPAQSDDCVFRSTMAAPGMNHIIGGAENHVGNSMPHANFYWRRLAHGHRQVGGGAGQPDPTPGEVIVGHGVLAYAAQLAE